MLVIGPEAVADPLSDRIDSEYCQFVETDTKEFVT